jgi:hypothetical protein
LYWTVGKSADAVKKAVAGSKAERKEALWQREKTTYKPAVIPVSIIFMMMTTSAMYAIWIWMRMKWHILCWILISIAPFIETGMNIGLPESSSGRMKQERKRTGLSGRIDTANER